MSIAFLRLPNGPQLLILEYLTLFQLFDFSLLSKRTNQIAKSRKRNIKELCWDADYARATFTLRLIDYEDNHFDIHIPLDTQMSTPGEVTFEGRQQLRTEEGEMSIGEEDQSIEQRVELFEKLSEHFLAMLDVEQYTVYESKAADLRKCFMWKYTKCLENLWVNVYNTDEDDMILTAEEVEFIFRELTVTGELMIYSKVAEGFQWTEPLKMEYVFLNDGRFLSLEVYLNSEVTEWRIYEDTLPSTHLNAISKMWLDGGLDQLKSFQVECSSNDEERRLDEVLEGIQTVPWDRRTRKRTWISLDTPINTSEGRDMRSGDGKLATAGFDDGRFYFVVWQSDQLQPDSSDEEVDEDVEGDED